MEKFEFIPLMSGTRVELSEELRKEMSGQIDSFGFVTPDSVPDFVLYGIWWNLKGASLEILFKRDSSKIRVRHQFGEKQEILSDHYSTSIYKGLIGSISPDDQIKVWLYQNKPDLWKQLVDHYGSDQKVFNNYVRFNH